MNLLTALIFLPIVVAMISLAIPASRTTLFRTINAGVCAVQLILLLFACTSFTPNATMQMIELHPWFSIEFGTFGRLEAQYFLGVDGLSFPLVALSVVIMTIVAVSSWNIQHQPKGYFILLMILNGTIIGTFTALDFLLFYLFFEFMLLPMYFLIGIWGGPRREYASIKFLLYTLLGSLFILIALIGLYVSAQSPLTPGQTVHTFNLLHLADPGNLIEGTVFSIQDFSILGIQARTWGFILLFAGFAIKLPIVPVHTWLPDAHVEAPTPVSVILAALLLKIGGYGLFRIAYPIFPDAAVELGWLVALLGVISILYGAFNALASKDLKRLIAYSSVSHMGFVLLGLASLTATGISGAVFQLVSHGVISAMLFVLAGVLYDRTHDRMIANYSGLASKMPAYFSFMLIGLFAAMGLPGFSGFIAEVSVLFGAFESAGTNGVLHESFALVAIGGIILAAGYCLWTLQRMFFGTFYSQPDATQLTDLTVREYVMLVPLAILTLLLGIMPQKLFNYLNPFSEAFADTMQRMNEFISSF